MRVGVVSLMHESNTFASGGTPFGAFERDRLVTGEAVREEMAGAHHEVCGFFDQLAEEGIEAVPVFSAWTMPSGVIESKAAEALVKQLLVEVERAGRIDGWLVAPHGAAVADGEPDFDGYWLTRFCERIRRGVPVVGTLDLHANLSRRMVEAADGWFAYETNPHLDQHATGVDAAKLIARTLRGEVRPVTAGVFPPMVVNIEAQATAESPCRELEAMADEIRRRPGVLSVSVLLGFPYADVPEMGASLTVTTDGDRGLAKRYAGELGLWWWERRERFQGDLMPVGEAVRRAGALAGPVCLLDMGDNVGGGGPADATFLAHELVRQRVGPAFVCLNDPEAVLDCTKLRVGGSDVLSVGGKTDDRHGVPLVERFTVRGLFDGVFEETEARHGGVKRFDQGPTAIVESEGGLTVMLSSRRTGPFSLRQLTAFGVDPAKFQVLVAKGVHAPVAAYAPVCKSLIRVNTPGVTSADLSEFAYENRRRPLYPFERDFAWGPDRYP